MWGTVLELVTLWSKSCSNPIRIAQNILVYIIYIEVSSDKEVDLDYLDVGAARVGVFWLVQSRFEYWDKMSKQIFTVHLSLDLKQKG